jgi:hypothetical protein
VSDEHPLAYLLGVEGLAAFVPDAARAAGRGVPAMLIWHFRPPGM